MPCAFRAAANSSRSVPAGSRMVYCAQTEVQPLARCGHGHDIAEPLRIALRDLVARGDLVLEDFQFFDQDRGLHGIEPPGQPETNIVVFVRALAVDADAAQRFGKFGIVGEDRPAVAEAAERLGREKAGRGDEAEGAETAALVAGAKRLRGVIEHEQALGFRDRADGIMVGALPEQVDRDHRPRLEAELLRGRDAALERIRRRY